MSEQKRIPDSMDPVGKSRQARMKLIQSQLTLANTLCDGVESELRNRRFAEARSLLKILYPAIQSLQDRIHNPQHVEGLSQRNFKVQIADVAKRMGEIETWLTAEPNFEASVAFQH